MLSALTCGCRKSSESAETSGSERRPTNVVLISLDTTRADHLGCYGHPKVKTPNLDRLAAEGVRFIECVSSAPITLPSHASLLTGVYPFVHGARDNSVFRLPDAQETLAEAMKQAGYTTVAEVAAEVLDRQFGLAQGFDVYTDTRGPTAGGHERPGSVIAERAVARLSGLKDRPFFLFLHFYDPHLPYAPPEPYASAYPGDPYLGEIAAVDAYVGRVLDALDELSLTERTLVVLTADHGEGLGQHDEPSHTTFVYDTTQLVPLLMRHPSRLPKGKVVASQTRLIDVAPTVLELLELPPLPRVQGVSLVPLIRGEGAPAGGLPAYAESLHTRFNYGYAALRALRAGGWKYIHAPTPELYHVAEDPGETKNLAAAHAERVREMQAQLRELLGAAGSGGPAADARHQASESSAKGIQGLGYVGGDVPDEDVEALAAGGELALFEHAGPDPKEHIAFINRAANAVGLQASRQFPAAEAELRALLADERQDARALYRIHKTLAAVLAEQGRNEEAAVAYQQALAAYPDDSDTMTELGIVLGRLKRYEEAIAVYRRALSIPPELAQTHLNLAVALAVTGRIDEAVAANRRALELNPQSIEAHTNLAVIFARTGRRADAVRELQAALKISPNDPALRQKLAQLQGGR